jgi:hypothetical protein
MYEEKNKKTMTKMLNRIISVAESPFMVHQQQKLAARTEPGSSMEPATTIAANDETPRSDDTAIIGGSSKSSASPPPFCEEAFLSHSATVTGVADACLELEHEAPAAPTMTSSPLGSSSGRGAKRSKYAALSSSEARDQGQDPKSFSKGTRKPIWQLKRGASEDSYSKVGTNATATALLPEEDAPVPTGNSFEELANNVSPLWSKAANKLESTFKAIESTIKVKGKGVLEPGDSKFLRLFKSEVGRVSAFYSEQLVEIDHHILSLASDVVSGGVVSSKERNDQYSKAIRKAKKDRELSIVRAHELLYKKMEELEAFATLNVVLCIKILKKHDKFVKSKDPSCFLYPRLMQEVVYPSSIGGVVPPSLWRDNIDLEYSKLGGLPPKALPFHRSSDEHSSVFLRLKKRLVDSFAEFCCDGDVVEAHGKLMMTKGDEGEVRKFLLWLALGANAVFIIWFIWDAIVDPGEGMTFWNDPAIYFYSFIGNVLIFEWTWATNVLIWERVGHINYLTILGLTLQHSPSPEWIYFKCAVGTIIFFINLNLYYKARRNDLQGYVDPSFFPFTLASIAFLYVATQVGFMMPLIPRFPY